MKSMRMLTVALLLLCAFAASAQPFVGDAVLSDVLASRHTEIQAAAPAVAMAKDRLGVAIAWTMLNAGGAQAVYVARLDSSGRIVAPVTEISSAGTANSVDAYWPSIAVSPGGTAFTLAWVERLRIPRPSSVSAIYCQLGRDLKPSAPRLLTTFEAASITTPPSCGWKVDMDRRGRRGLGDSRGRIARRGVGCGLAGHRHGGHRGLPAGRVGAEHPNRRSLSPAAGL